MEKLLKSLVVLYTICGAAFIMIGYLKIGILFFVVSVIHAYLPDITRWWYRKEMKKFYDNQ